MRPTRALAITAVVVLSALLGAAQANAEVSVSIGKHASLTTDGAIVIRVHIACDPLPGTEDYQEALAGAVQGKTAAAAEGGIDGAVACDGVLRTHTARLSPFTRAVFKRGPAVARASIMICNVVEDEQVCEHVAAEQRVVIRGAVVP
jgi:hypothetical protein